MPTERNGPNGTSDLIVRLFLSVGKFILVAIFPMPITKREKAAPIQKAKTTADNPIPKPSKIPITTKYFISPKPNHFPLETKKIMKNGRAKIKPDKIGINNK